MNSDSTRTDGTDSDTDILAFHMAGHSPAFEEMARLIRKIAACDAPVLIEGETGTGKELAARAIHYLGARCPMPFVPVNCGAIPDTLIENELFGHRKGAFTDARDSQRGLVAQARGGTLFLDEIDALSAKGQVTLLRFLQDLQYRPLGGEREESADIRIIAATNVDLLKHVESGSFRPDLLFRLKILSLALPPLRERTGDAELLARHFIRQCSARYGKPVKTLHPDTIAWLNSHTWPGNVRELENVIHREFLLADGPAIDLVRDPDRVERRRLADRRRYETVELDFGVAKARAIAQFERTFLCQLMSEARGNVTHAARIAGKERRAFGKLLKKHGIDKTPYLSNQ